MRQPPGSSRPRHRPSPARLGVLPRRPPPLNVVDAFPGDRGRREATGQRTAETAASSFGSVGGGGWVGIGEKEDVRESEMSAAGRPQSEGLSEMRKGMNLTVGSLTRIYLNTLLLSIKNKKILVVSGSFGFF